MQIITGYTGESHITSADDASLYRGIFGAGDYVLDVGSKFAATIIDNNTIRIADGDLVIQGHQARIRANDYEEVTIDNGTPGLKRNDLIVARYKKNTTTGIESITLEVVKGIPGETAVDPDIVQEDLTVGGTQRDFPLYRVSLNGLVLESITSLFTVLPSLKLLDGEIKSFVEEGTWMPSLDYLNGDNTGIEYLMRVGRYIKQGKIMTVFGFISLFNKGNGGGEAVRILGLPFTVIDFQPVSVYIQDLNLPSNYKEMIACSEGNSIRLRYLRDDGTMVELPHTAIKNYTIIRIVATFLLQL